MRLPNGYGSVTKLNDKKRRNPYWVRVPGGSEKVIKPDGTIEYKVKRVTLGYYKSKSDAMNALAEYNKTPFNLESKDLTFSEIYDVWKKYNYEQLKEKTKVSRDAAYKHCRTLYNMRIRDIKLADLQNVIDSCPAGSATQKNIRTIMHSVFEYAMQCDIVYKDYSSYVKITARDSIIDRTVFSHNDIEILWNNSEKWDIQIILILLYSGMRVNELLKNSKSNVDLEKGWIYVPEELAKNKTSIRFVPIHDKIMPFIETFYLRAKDNLITNSNGYNVTYNNFVSRNLKQINKLLSEEHRFHDTRHTFISKCHELGIDDLSIKRIVGHTSNSITDNVYTHIEFNKLKESINQLKL